MKQLTLAVVAVALFAGAAHIYLKQNSYEVGPDVIGVDATGTEVQSAPANTAADTSAPATTQVATPPASVTQDTQATDIESSLSALDALFEEEYDDSSVDQAFSSNLDDAI